MEAMGVLTTATISSLIGLVEVFEGDGGEEVEVVQALWARQRYLDGGIVPAIAGRGGGDYRGWSWPVFVVLCSKRTKSTRWPSMAFGAFHLDLLVDDEYGKKGSTRAFDRR